MNIDLNGISSLIYAALAIFGVAWIGRSALAKKKLANLEKQNEVKNEVEKKKADISSDSDAALDARIRKYLGPDDDGNTTH